MAAAGVMEAAAVSWAPVVYARTASADTWWQALPAGVTGSGWLARAVGAVFAGGAELDVAPRFLLAQDHAYRVAGVACRARQLSDRMCTDDQQRELSCFVGWMAPRAQAAGTGGPAFSDLAAGYAQWAGPVYEEVMGAVWKLPHSPFRQPAMSSPAAAPWDETISFDLEGPVPRPDGGPWPPPAWEGIWTVALATAGPFTCVLGWERAPLGQPADVTFLGTADAPPREAPALPDRTVLSPVPEPLPVPAPLPVPEPRPVPVPEPVPIPAGTAAWSRRKKIAVTSLLVAAVVAIVAIVLLLTARNSPAKPPPPRVTVSPSSRAR
jgi:hypothetical protein